MKVYCVLGQDMLNDGEYCGDSWLIKVFKNKKDAENFINKNKYNDDIFPLSYGTRCEGYIQEGEVE